MARPKEPRFFIDADEPFGRWGRGLDWYRSLFHSHKPVCGETSPTYATWPYRQGVMEKMSRVVPKAKIVFVVREHFARLRSSYRMAVRYRGLEKSFEDFVRESPWALAGSYYGYQIQNILQFYPIENICILESEDLQKRREDTLEKVFKFLGVNSVFRSRLFYHKRHVSTWHAYPNSTGRKILRSRTMANLETKLPGSVIYHFRNLLNLIFFSKRPETSLPQKFEEELRSAFHKDTILLRELTGMSCKSLTNS